MPDQTPRYCRHGNDLPCAQCTADEADPNSEWLTLAHTMCTDAGIPQGHILERLQTLSQALQLRRLTGDERLAAAEEIAERHARATMPQFRHRQELRIPGWVLSSVMEAMKS